MLMIDDDAAVTLYAAAAMLIFHAAIPVVITLIFRHTLRYAALLIGCCFAAAIMPRMSHEYATMFVTRCHYYAAGATLRRCRYATCYYAAVAMALITPCHAIAATP